MNLNIGFKKLIVFSFGLFIVILTGFGLTALVRSNDQKELSKPLVIDLQPTGYQPDLESKFKYHWSLQPRYNFDDLTAKSYLLAKADDFLSDKPNFRILANRDIQTPRSIASLTKIMTALVVLSEYDLDQEIIITDEVSQIGEASMNLKTGEIYTVKELLWGMLLLSANDASEALARNHPTGRQGFIQAMNDYADKLNLSRTHFVNPSGLDEDDGSYNQSSALDLIILSWHTYYKFPLFRQIVGQRQHRLSSKLHADKLLINKMGLDKTYPGIVGIKAGNSDTAGLTVVELLKKGQDYYLVVLLDSLHPQKEVKQIFETVFGI